MNKKYITYALFAALSIPALSFAQSEMGERMKASSTQRVKPVINTVCMQTAIEKRDTAIIAAHDAHSAATKSALTARKDAVKAAWALPTAKEVAQARKAANDTFSSSVKGAHSALRTARNAAWEAFNTDKVACGHPGAKESPAVIPVPTASL